VIQRDRLVACLMEEVEGKYAGVIWVLHGVECAQCDWLPGGGATLTRRKPLCRDLTAQEQEAENCATEDPAMTKVTVPFVIGAEGNASRQGLRLVHVIAQLEPNFPLRD